MPSNLETSKQYCEDILSNIQPSNQHTKLACQRFLLDLKDDNYFYDEDDVDTLINFCQSFYLTEVQPLTLTILQPWQVWIICNLFGLKSKETLKRKYKLANISVARGNGKTQLCALLCLYELLFGFDAQIILASTTNKSVMEVDFDKIKKLVNQIDTSHKHIKVYYNKIVYKNNKIIVTSNESAQFDGLSGSLMLLDEMFTFERNNIYGVLRSSLAKRQDSILMIISTAGFSQDTEYYRLCEYSKAVLEGRIADNSHFAVIYSIDKEDIDSEDLYDNETYIKKSNPNYGISVQKDTVISELQTAKQSFSERISILVKHLNIFHSANIENSWLEEKYVNAAMQNISLDDAIFKDAEVYIGVDLASVSDLTAVVTLAHIEDKIYFFPKFFLPEDSVNNNANKDLFMLANSKHELQLTSGNVTDYRLITKYILEINANNNIISISYDRFNSIQWAIEATEAGLYLVPYSQTAGNLNKPLKAFEHLIKSGKIIIQRNSIAKFCCMNAKLMVNKMGNYSLNRENRNAKIDFCAAAINALGIMLENPYSNIQIY